MNMIILHNLYVHVAYIVYNHPWWYKFGLVPILNGLGIQIKVIFITTYSLITH